jgi:transcriptional regulator with XRE-family HTH domain
LSPEDLAARCGISPAVLTHLEQRFPPILETLGRLARALEVTVYDLIEDEPPSTQPPPPALFRVEPVTAVEDPIAAVQDALASLAPLPLTPLQVQALTNLPHLEVRATLQYLATRHLIGHPRSGYYQHRPPEDEPDGRP